MRTHCATCGKKVPKKRMNGAEGSVYSALFCCNTCHMKYADQVIGMARESELEVQQEISQEIKSGKGPWNEILEDMDEVAAEAASTTGRPQEIAAHFLGAMAGKLATKLAPKIYEKFAETAKAWRIPGSDRGPRPEIPKVEAPQPKPAPKPAEPSQTKSETQPPRPSQPRSPQPRSPQTPPSKKRIPEPANLDELSLTEQRKWLLQRFFLPPTATKEELEAKYKILVKKYHPDMPGGNSKVMSLINSSRQKFLDVEAELTPKQKIKRKA